MEPAVISRKHIEAVQGMHKDDLNPCEIFLKIAMQQYWFDLHDSAHILGQVLLKEVGEFFRKVGRKWTSISTDTTFKTSTKLCSDGAVIA